MSSFEDRHTGECVERNSEGENDRTKPPGWIKAREERGKKEKLLKLLQPEIATSLTAPIGAAPRNDK